MSRRFPKIIVNRHEDGNRASIGDSDVSAACVELDIAAKKEVALMVPHRFSTDELIPMLFPDQLVADLAKVKSYVTPASQFGYYTTGKAERDAKLTLDFEKAPIPPPTLEGYRAEPSRVLPLVDAINTTTQIREKYAAVKHMLRWFNRNATPAAVRAYWPSVLTLCPTGALAREYADMPSRYITPPGIGNYLPLIRDTATTVAGMQLLPSDARLPDCQTVRLTFGEGPFMREDLELRGNSITFNL